MATAPTYDPRAARQGRTTTSLTPKPTTPTTTATGWNNNAPPDGATQATAVGRQGGPLTEIGDEVRARTSVVDLANQYLKAQPGAAPQTTATQVAAPTTVTAPTVGAAPTVGGVTVQRTSLPSAAGGVASQVAAPAPVGAAQVGGLERASAAAIQSADQAQARARLLSLLDQQERIASGDPNAPPSVAALQAKASAEEAIRTQQSLAAGARGQNVLASRLGAAQNIADLQAKAARDAALLRAKEAQDARAGLLEGYLGARNQDIGLATSQAQLTQQTNLTNATEANKRTALVAQLEQEAAQADAQRRLAAATTTAQLATTTSNENAGRETQASIAGANIQSEQSRTQATLDAERAAKQAELDASMQRLQAELGERAGEFSATAQNTANAQQAQIDTQTKLANMDALLRQKGLDQATRSDLLNAWLTAQNQVLNYDTAQRSADMQRDQANRQFVTQLVGAGLTTAGTVAGAAIAGPPGAVAGGAAGSTAGAAVASDRRTKTAIRELVDSYDDGEKGGKGDEIDQLLGSLKAYRFKYKDPKMDGAAPGERFGVMAQDLEKTPAGASIVIEDRGVKKIDTAQAVGVLLAAMARMNQRLKKGGR